MVRYKGWQRKVNNNNRMFWRNKNMDAIVGVDKVGHYWYVTKGSSKKQETSSGLNTKSKAVKRARNYMKFHSY